ncbi:hypothetical protein [Streptomyces rochei]|uniref:hypothetical protein n=1 Tax=Streptomyces rochei TaxID=1928 RepID=UPI00369D352D
MRLRESDGPETDGPVRTLVVDLAFAPEYRRGPVPGLTFADSMHLNALRDALRRDRVGGRESS